MARIEIITIGDELVDGRLLDTNAGWLSDRLTCVGFAVERHTSIRDDKAEIITAFRGSASRSDAVIVSGGLGPTTDDLTAECAAAAAGVQLHTFAEALDHVESFFAARGRRMSPNNAKQADLPAGSRLLPNPEGTAVGFCVPIDGCDFFFLPGVPRELEHIFEETVLPDLQRSLVPDPPLVHTIKAFGKGESDVGELLDGLGAGLPSPAELKVQYRATFPEIHVRLVVRGLEAEHEVATIDSLARDAEARLGSAVFASGRGTLPATFIDTVAAALEREEATIAIADCFTGGVITDLLTRAPSGANVLRGSIAAASIATGASLLGAGGVSSMEDLAIAIRRRTGATFGLAVSGSAEGTEVDPPGTIRVALTGDAETVTKTRTYTIDSPRLKRLAAYVAMSLVRRQLVPITSA